MPRWPWTWPRASHPVPNPWFPNLIPGKNGNHKRVSWSTSRYNCIAWAADDAMRPWWPQSLNAYWPSAPVINDVTIPAFVSAFNSIGYELCADRSLERGFEKIALYASPDKVPLHAARQLRSGAWTSKMGSAYWPDIRHSTVLDVVGLNYGHPVRYMRRRRRTLLVESLSHTIRLFRIMYWEIETFVRWCRYGGTMYDD